MAKNNLLISAQALFDKKDYPSALQELNQIILQEPENYEAYHLRGLVYFNLKKYEKAAYDLRQRINLGVTTKNYVDAEICITLGDCYSQLKKKDQAIESFSIYIDSRKQMNKVDNNIKFALAHRLRAEIYIKKFAINNAIANLETSLLYNNRDYEAYTLLVPLYAQYNENGKAIEKLTQAIQLKLSPLANLYSYRAECYLKQGFFAEAAADYQQSVTLKPNNAELGLKYAKFLKNSGQLKEAEKECNRLLDLKNLDGKIKIEIDKLLQPSVLWLTKDVDIELKNSLENYAKATKHFEQGIINLKQALELKSSGNNARANVLFKAAETEFQATNSYEGIADCELGIVNFHLQNYQKAIFNFNLVQELDDLCHLRRAICLYKTNQLDAANEDFFYCCELVLYRIYQKNNQILPLVEKERKEKINEFIDELINFPEELDNYFEPNSMTYALLNQALTCYKEANKNDKRNEKSVAALPNNGLFKSAPKNKQETDLQINLDKQEVEPETNLWVMD